MFFVVCQFALICFYSHVQNHVQKAAILVCISSIPRSFVAYINLCSIDVAAAHFPGDVIHSLRTPASTLSLCLIHAKYELGILCIFIWNCIHISTCIFIYSYIYIYSFILIYIHIYKYIFKYIHIYIYIHICEC